MALPECLERQTRRFSSIRTLPDWQTARLALVRTQGLCQPAWVYVILTLPPLRALTSRPVASQSVGQAPLRSAMVGGNPLHLDLAGTAKTESTVNLAADGYRPNPHDQAWWLDETVFYSGQDVGIGGPASKAAKTRVSSCSSAASICGAPSNDSMRPRVSRASAAWASGSAPK